MERSGLWPILNYYYYYYYYYYYKSTDYSDASLKLQGHFTYQMGLARRKSSKSRLIVFASLLFVMLSTSNFLFY